MAEISLGGTALLSASGRGARVLWADAQHGGGCMLAGGVTGGGRSRPTAEIAAARRRYQTVPTPQRDGGEAGCPRVGWKSGGTTLLRYLGRRSPAHGL